MSPHRIFIEIKCFLKGKNIIGEAHNCSEEHYCIVKFTLKRSQKNVKAKKEEHLFKIFVVMLTEASKHLPVSVNNINTGGRCQICSKVTIKTPERSH